jgi:acetyl esterase/lipase
MDAVILDEEIAPALAAFPITANLSVDALPAMRETRGLMFAGIELSDAVERTEHVVVDDPRVVVRVHRPKGVDGPLPCIFSIHGGGYIVGSYDMDDAKFDRQCVHFPCVGVSVEYRLAPETPYPGPLDDCYAGLRWTYEHAAELGIAPDRIGISGVSAGGGLAAALALLARDRGEVPVAFQLLECPMIDDRPTTSSSRLDGLPIWSRESNEFGWRSYLGERYGGDVPAYAAAARATDLAGLPPALVIVGGADGFRDEDIEYALRLNQAGVPTELHVLPGAPHGVQYFADSVVARRWNQMVTQWLEQQLR